MNKTKIIALILAIGVISTLFGACAKDKPSTPTADNSKKSVGIDLSVPTLGKDGWYMVFEDDFNGTALNEGIKFGNKYNGSHEIWTYSPHALRWASNDAEKPEQACYWCDEMVSIKDGNLIVTSRFEDNHECSGDCPKAARFTGGIETRKIVKGSTDLKGNSDELLFSQAYGYFEVRAKFPDADGLWSAFWLQSSSMRKPAAEGVDGTEIDVFESAFRKNETSRMGHALLWNGYGEYGKVSGNIIDLEQDLYDGYHTYALKWTPEYYVFYIDGVPTWSTTDGGVSHVKEFLRLTVEIDAGDEYGPHGQEIGAFDHTTSSEFCVDYVKVWQNENYEPYIIDDSMFPGTLDQAN